ncbi:leucine-rich repeat protein [Ruminococcus sp.]|uniref:leucine-rich repeat protein n=1 Tax=Ruminococcus sp. TaxID=41978 RepID=UPI0025ECC038|nr:leucine-rich repeat protein [Ruminococcus sp.]
MKKLISALAAFAVICSSFASVSLPSVSVFSVDAAEVGATDVYDYEGSDKKTDTFERNGMLFDIYENASGKYAVLTSVKDDSINELNIPAFISLKEQTSEETETIEIGSEEDENGNQYIVTTNTKYIPVVAIGDSAFKNCTNLEKLNLSKNIAVFNWSAIAVIYICEINAPDDSEYFASDEGILYTKDMSTLVACPPGIMKTEVKVSDKTEKIGDFAFVCCKDILEVELPDSVIEIGTYAFFGCSVITDMKLSENLKLIDAYAFAGCKSLKELTIPESVESIKNEAFKDAGCVDIEGDIHYVDKWAVGSESVIEVGDIKDGTVGTCEGLFVTRNYLKIISVPASVKHLGSYLAFGIQMPLERVVFYCSEIPERSIGCVGVKEVIISDPKCKIADAANSLPTYWREVEPFTGTINDYPIDYTLDRLEVHAVNTSASSVQKAINTALIEIDNDDDDVITRVIRNSGTVNNDENTQIRYASPIKKNSPVKYDTIIRGADDSTAEAYARKYRRCFENFVVNANVGPEILDDIEAGITFWIYDEYTASARLYGNHDQFRDVVIPDKINGVPVKTFVVGTNLNAGKVTIPASVEYISDNLDFQFDNTEYYVVSEDNPCFKSIDGVIYNKDMTELIKVPSKYKAEELIIPDTVKTIRRGACHSLKNVLSIQLPEGLETIGANAFCGAGKLCKINLPETLDTICDNAFCGCVSLEEIIIPDSVNHIGLNAFDECPAVEYENGHGYLSGWLVDVNDDVTDEKGRVYNVAPKYGTKGIARVSARNSITIPKSVTKMSWEMIPDNLYCTLERADVFSHKIDYDAFKNASFMKDIYIYDPECEICAGDQTIPAQHLEFDEDSDFIRSIFDAPRGCNALTRTPYRELHIYGDTHAADTVIHGYKGSTAELYAEYYGVKFSALEDETTYKNGDLNGDGIFDVADYVFVNKFIAGKYQFTEQQFWSADLNNDGKVDVFDLVEYRKALISKIDN